MIQQEFAWHTGIGLVPRFTSLTVKSGVKRHPQYKATLNRTTLLRLFFTEKKSAPDMRVLFIIATVSVLIPAFAEASLQCVSCTGGSCETSNPKTEDCDEKCYTMELRKKSPDEEDPFVVKGCTSDSLFWRRSCVNKCYDSKEFGSSLYYMCVHCCSEDKCNSCSRVKDGIIMVVVSAAIALVKYLYF